MRERVRRKRSKLEKGYGRKQGERIRESRQDGAAAAAKLAIAIKIACRSVLGGGVGGGGGGGDGTCCPCRQVEQFTKIT